MVNITYTVDMYNILNKRLLKGVNLKIIANILKVAVPNRLTRIKL